MVFADGAEGVGGAAAAAREGGGRPPCIRRPDSSWGPAWQWKLDEGKAS